MIRSRMFGCFIVAFLVNVWIIFLFSSAFSAEPRYGGTLRVGVLDRTDNQLDSRYVGAPLYFPAPFMIYDGLLQWGEKGYEKPVPALATSYETKDNKVWVFHLRKGVKFHNGREMTAEDVKTNFDWLIETPKGWKPLMKRGSFSDLQKVEVMDRYTVRMTLKRPFGPFPKVIARDMNAIAPPEEVEKWGDKFTFHPVGTGPFKAMDLKEDKVVLERFDGYWGPKPYLDRVEYIFIRSDEARLIALQKGELDIAHLSYAAKPTLDKDPNLIWHKIFLSDGLNRLFFNFRRWPMNDIRFRKAVWMGADWKNININAHPFQSGDWARTYLEFSTSFNPEALKLVPAYNPEEAKKLIQAVEKDAGKKIPPLFYLDTDAEVRKAIGEMAKIQLAQIGVPLNLQNVPRGIYNDKLRMDPKIEWDIGQQGFGFEPDPYIGFSYYLTNSGAAADGKSLGGYSNPEFDRWVQKAIEALKDEERIKCYQEAEKVLLMDVAGVPLYPSRSTIGYNKKVKGFIPNPLINVIVTSDWANMWIEK